MRMRPLPGLCAAFAAGVLLAGASSWAVWCLALSSVALFFIGLARGRRVLPWITLLVLAGWLGAVRCAMVRGIPTDDVSQLPSTSLTVIGTADEEITVEDDPRTDDAYAAKFILNVSSARLDTGTQGSRSAGIPVTGRVVVHMSLRSRNPLAHGRVGSLPEGGDVVELRGRLERPSGPRNPGGFDYRGYLARQGIFATLAVAQPEHVRVVRHAGWRNPFLMLAHALRHQEIMYTTRYY